MIDEAIETGGAKPSKAKALAVAALLDGLYAESARCYLNYETPWQLLIATILSAQCTDARVNLVTERLFAKYPTLEAFAFADLSELEKDIFSTGFYRAKASGIKEAANRLILEYGGAVPSDMDALTSLPHVGRKTANIIRTHIFGIPSIAVDTHVGRLSRLIGLTKSTDPAKVELDLMEIFPVEYWSKYNEQAIAHGRAVCVARRPSCEICALSGHCDHYRDTAPQT